jgi:mannan polymerase II complex ANP1 subunit
MYGVLFLTGLVESNLVCLLANPLMEDDLNSWQESETALQLARELPEDAVIVEGYAEYATWRPHLAYLRDPYGDPLEEMDLDGVGGVSILTKSRVHRSGTLFPAFSYERHAETEVREDFNYS